MRDLKNNRECQILTGGIFTKKHAGLELEGLSERILSSIPCNKQTFVNVIKGKSEELTVQTI